jgi:hypothetical protein
MLLAASAAIVFAAACSFSGQTVREVVDRHLPEVRAKYKPVCDAARIPWPPKRLRIIVLKQERRLELWAAGKSGNFSLLADFAVLAASGTPGPKRREGDRQVPEGIYALPMLNPNSSYHLSIFVDYPNRSDVVHSRLPRSQMGGEIYIHGRAVSIGCVAIGDRGIEELFTICALVSSTERKAIICPVDFRKNPNFRVPGEEAWVGQLYDSLRAELRNYPR